MVLEALLSARHMLRQLDAKVPQISHPTFSLLHLEGSIMAATFRRGEGEEAAFVCGIPGDWIREVYCTNSQLKNHQVHKGKVKGYRSILMLAGLCMTAY